MSPAVSAVVAELIALRERLHQKGAMANLDDIIYSRVYALLHGEEAVRTLPKGDKHVLLQIALEALKRT